MYNKQKEINQRKISDSIHVGQIKLCKCYVNLSKHKFQECEYATWIKKTDRHSTKSQHILYPQETKTNMNWRKT